MSNAAMTRTATAPILMINHFKMLPMAEDQFMIPSSYFFTFEFVKEDNQTMGYKLLMMDGSEIFTEKASGS